jgi:DNA-binding CsgD family transcriptional regulator/tetratricopeptide (TPR) repeat protein
MDQRRSDGESTGPAGGEEFPPGMDGGGALLGRGPDCAEMSGLTQAIREGRSRSLVIVGDPGVGKTTLLRYARSRAHGVRIVAVAGVESEARLGFATLHRLLLPFLPAAERLPPPQRDALLRTFGMARGAPPDRFLLGLAVLTLLAGAAADRPLLFLVDDAHWLDRESVEVLAFVARRLYADRVGIVLSTRPDGPTRTALNGLPTRELGTLDAAAAQALLKDSVPGSLNPRVAARIVTETGGNPLALVELAGRLTADQLAGRAPLPRQLPVASGIEAHFRRRVGALPAATRSLVLLAAAASTDDPVALWRAAATLGLPADAAAAAVAHGIASFDPVVAFRHPLIRSAIYAGAEPAARRAAHRAWAAVAAADGDVDQAVWHRAAAATGPDEAVAAELDRSAQRIERRGGYRAQAELLNRAAELSSDPHRRALRRYAAAQAYLGAGDGALAEAMLDQAAPRLDETGDHVAVQRLRASIAVFFSRHQDAPAILLEAVDHVAAGDCAKTRQLLFEALQPALVAGRYTAGTTAEAVARAALAAPRDPACAATGTDLLLDGFATRTVGDYADAAPLLREAVATLFTEGPAASAGIPATILGWFAADDVWDDAGRWAMLRRAEEGERRRGALGALRVTLAGLCSGHVWAGRPAEAADCYREAAEISALIGVPPPATTGVLIELRAWQGDEQQSRELAASTAGWGRERRARVLEFFALMGLTVLDMGLVRYAEALESALEIYADDPPGFGNRILPEVVEAGVRTGAHRIAEAALARLTGRATASGTPWALGMLARSQALMARPDEAEIGFRAALDRLSRTTVRTELARTHLLYGEWLRRRKRRRDAQTQLAAARGMFDAMGAAGFAGRTRAEQLANGEKPQAGAAGPGPGLTPQEAHVSRLAAAGATNAEIATRLFVTPSTVEYHLSKVFRKLNITSRRQLGRALSATVAGHGV